MSSNSPDDLRYPLLPLRGHVVLPGMTLSLLVGRPGSLRAIEEARATDGRLAAVTLKNPEIDQPGVQDFYPVGTVVSVQRAQRTAGGKLEVEIRGELRCAPVWDGTTPETWVRVRVMDQAGDPEEDLGELMRQVLVAAQQWSLQQGHPLPGGQASPAGNDPVRLADDVAAAAPLKLAERQAVLAEGSAKARLEHLLDLFTRDARREQLETAARERLNSAGESTRRKQLLREQLKLIREELGENDGRTEEREELRRLADSKELPPVVRERVHAEIDRLERMPPMAGEVALIRSYLDLVLDLPWTSQSEAQTDLDAAQRLLDEEHFGVEAVKERILDYIAVCQVRGRIRGPILCLVGPPGVGKTSLARSIARSLGREFVRFSLGGVREEGEIRGHRRVYMGAQPGRLIQGIRAAGTCNPVMLLDEIDKLAADFRGDPSAAFLEVLDPEQNSTFRDHFLELPFDLSRVLFIATANDVASIPGPLRDRMEILRLSAYTEDEKVQIALRHLLPRQMAEHGLEPDRLVVAEAAVRMLVREYTWEAGVRELERKLGQVCRKALRTLLREAVAPVRVMLEDLSAFVGAPRFRPRVVPDEPQTGVSLALSVSEAGGSVSRVEVTSMPGTGRQLLLTGGLGEMMRDSAQAVHSWIRANAADLGIPAGVLEESDLHLHMSGGGSKNGTSGAVAMAVAMVSALTGRPVQNDVAMTGEVSLTGRVLPVGGVREKMLAACREGLTRVILPQANLEELTSLPASVRESVEVVPVLTVWDALDHALRVATHV